MLIAIFIIVATVVGMELFSWAIHKYLFHGILWRIHKTHHGKKKGWFELNDIFSLSFALTAIFLMITGRNNLDFYFWIGAGITLYGVIYFVFHDVFMHNRFKSFKTNNSYLLRIRRAHKIHHKSLEKKPSESFGLLYVSKKYQVQAKN